MAGGASDRDEESRRLTDMSGAEYRVEDAKQEFREKRESRVDKLRREGDFDEDGEAFKKAFDWQIMRRLLRYLKPYRLQLVSAVALLLVYSVLVPAFPNLIAIAVDRYIVAETLPFSNLTEDERFRGLLTIVMIYLGLRIVNFGLR
jgi:ATP-binding cassette subfamily B protein